MRHSTTWLASVFCVAIWLADCRANEHEVTQEPPAAGAIIWPGRVANRHGREPGTIRTGARLRGGLCLKSGGGSGCVIRHGYLVKEWGDPTRLADIKSATKGTVGTTLLGLALDRHLVTLRQ